MALKMKGFPLRSAFKHTGGGASHEDHHDSGEGSDTSNVEGNKNVTNQNVGKKDPFMPSTPEFEASYADAKMKKARAYYERMMKLYNSQLNNPKIPRNEVMNKPIEPTEENIDDFRADGSYGV